MYNITTTHLVHHHHHASPAHDALSAVRCGVFFMGRAAWGESTCVTCAAMPAANAPLLPSRGRRFQEALHQLSKALLAIWLKMLGPAEQSRPTESRMNALVELVRKIKEDVEEIKDEKVCGQELRLGRKGQGLSSPPQAAVLRLRSPRGARHLSCV